MAKLEGPIKFTGRVGGLSYYKVGDEIYVRQPNPPSAKKIKNDPKYTLFRLQSTFMGRGSKIGSEVYQALPKDFRQKWMYYAFVQEAIALLRNQYRFVPDEEVYEILWKTYVEIWEIKSRDTILSEGNRLREIRQHDRKKNMVKKVPAEVTRVVVKDRTIRVKINRKSDEVALPVCRRSVFFKRNDLPVHYARAPACDEFRFLEGLSVDR